MPASAKEVADLHPQLRELFPSATRYGAPTGNPPATPIYKGDEPIGYAFLTKPVVAIPAYSGKPINNLVGLDLTGRIVGVRIVEHEEPILVIGVTEDDLRHFVGQYRGKSAYDRISVGGSMRKGDVVIDAITGASITAMVENATVMKSAKRVAAARGIGVAGRVVAPVAATNTQEGSLLEPSPSKSTQNTVVQTQTEEPLWMMVWRQRVFQIVMLSIGLIVLMLVLVFQDWLSCRPSLLWYVRNGYLLFTVVFIGWYALAQLSVFNVLTFIHVLLREFNWEAFLINPMIFILWGFVAVTLLLWGRGIFCGWLCPYGALQEFVQQIAQRLRVPQLEFPEVVHERLWAIKYIILLMLFGISLQSLGTAARYVEVEPFKTAITLHFQREWTFVVYAAGLLVISAFNSKFYCKYLCALGAALAIAGRFRIFDWLRRHRECGRPCQICNHECPSGAIRHSGEINENECHYCLDCQVTYWNVYRCPPMVNRLKRRERGATGLAKAFVGFQQGSVKVAPPEPSRGSKNS
ncbi:MAG: 4Fe-4S binding protein [Gammaproteobacteria bacterium]|jgi:polyferredoxin|nr:4Fe-4S binding protein [Gammaproteobacteria bacterium]